MRNVSMSRGRWVRVALFLAPLLLTGVRLGQCDEALDEIVGTWRGSSVCVDRNAAPACNDEQVVYEIAPNPGNPRTVAVKADKILEGRRVPMGVLEFTRNAADGSWTTTFESPRVHALWRLTVSGKEMRGTMTLLPSKAVVRKMTLRKEE